MDRAAGETAEATSPCCGQAAQDRLRPCGEDGYPPELAGTDRAVVRDEHGSMNLTPHPGRHPMPDGLGRQVPPRLVEAHHIFLMEEQPGQLVRVIARQPATPGSR
ncbi:hypothetical protein [Micromonospora sp. NPDC050276]|uniref:hypothetical protein n=1 Tax=Micromonospora sp. NPDC050276 TaxID=3364278 RepID=UPI003787F391